MLHCFPHPITYLHSPSLPPSPPPSNCPCLQTKKTYQHYAHEMAVLKNEIPLAPAKAKEKVCVCMVLCVCACMCACVCVCVTQSCLSL